MKEENEQLSPLFHFLQEADWPGIDIKTEEKWKLWYLSVPEPETEDEPTPSLPPPRVLPTKKKLVVTREIKTQDDEQIDEDPPSDDSRDSRMKEEKPPVRQIKLEERFDQSQVGDYRGYGPGGCGPVH